MFCGDYCLDQIRVLRLPIRSKRFFKRASVVAKMFLTWLRCAGLLFFFLFGVLGDYLLLDVWRDGFVVAQFH